MRELALSDVMSWLRSKLSSALKPLAKEWGGLRRDAEKALRDLRDACERIREEGEKCLKDRDTRKHKPGRAALRFHKLMAGILDNVEVPGPELSTDAIVALQKTLARVYNAVGKEWSGLLAQMEPYMIRARMRLKGVWRRLGDIVRALEALRAQCEPLEREEEVAAAVSKIEKLIDELRSVEVELGSLSLEQEELQQERSELEARMDRLSEELSGLRAAEEAVRVLSMEVRTELRHAWKPLVKLRASAGSGIVALSQEEREALEAYLSDPASALAKDGDGYPGLRALLNKLRDCLERGSIKLKPSKAQKLSSWLEKALSGSLSPLQERCRRALAELEAIRASKHVSRALSELETVEARLSELSKRLEWVKTRMATLSARRESLSKKIEDELRALGSLLADITGEEVRVLSPKLS